jgi:hypothetical protein
MTPDELTRLGDELTDLQVRYRAASLTERMAMKPQLDAALKAYNDEQARQMKGQ